MRQCALRALNEHRQRWRVCRSLALREFALEVDALERFVHHELSQRVHECVMGVLALESQPLDRRL